MNTKNIDLIAKFLGYDPEIIYEVITISDVADPDGAYINFQDMGMDEHAEAVEAIFFEYGGLDELLQAIAEEEQEEKAASKYRTPTPEELEEIAAREEEAAALEEHWRSQAASPSSEKPTTENFW